MYMSLFIIQKSKYLKPFAIAKKLYVILSFVLLAR